MSSEIKANSIQDKTGTRVLASDSGSAWSWGANVPVGTVLQVVNVPFNDQLVINGTTPGDVKEFDALTITSGSKLLIQLNCNLGGNSNSRLKYLVKTASDGSYATLSSASGIGSNTLSAQSGSNAIGADEIIVNHQHSTVEYFSNMTTSSHLIGPITSTYFRLKLQLYSIGSEGSSINRRVGDTDQAGRSYITFTEIAQ
jgi:hypothetical protein